MMDFRFLQLCLIFSYHHFCCSNAQENTRLCTSPCNQCNFTFVCDPPPPATCIRENIALGKKASMSSEFTTKTVSPEPNTTLAACLAFDGYRNTHYTESTSYTSPDCIHTLNNAEEWLQVDLGRNYTITNITVYRRDNDNEVNRLANILITVDSQQCYQFPANVTGFPRENNVKCTTPMTGRIVKLSTRRQYLNLCEIEIWGCKSGRYGELCDGVCHCRNNTICDNYFGTCVSGCDVGYYGLNCSLQCGHCSDQSQCNESGHCTTGCQRGWQEPKCDFCQSGFFGLQCSKCGNCKEFQPCNSTTGICSNGCADGYASRLCNETCSNKKYGPNCSLSCGRCKNAVPCDAVNGNCIECETNFSPPLCIVCQSGFFGPQCTKCGKCKNSQPCNSTTGVCSSGCDDGYETPLCNETCRNKTYGPSCSKPCGRCKNAISCDVINGSCAECELNFLLPFCKDCKNGFYGTDCNKTCGSCNLSHECNRDNGTCLAGCADGYELPNCIETCKNKTFGPSCSNPCGQCKNATSCDPINGSCTECEMNLLLPFCKDCKIGFYGSDCNKTCGFCSLSRACNRDNGICLDECADGYKPPFCIERCGAGYYGTNCTLRCGYCNDMTQCNSSGHCLTGCQNGWQGTMCQEEVNSDGTGTIVGAVIGSIVAVTIITVIAVFVFRYLRRRKTAGNNNEVAKELSRVRTSVKPQATVKPTVMKTPTRNEQNSHDLTGHIYANMAGKHEEDCGEDELASNPEIILSDDYVVFEDSNQLYGNDETIYATLKSARHELDRAQRYLVDQLTSGKLLEEFKKLPRTLRKPHEAALLSSNIRKNRFAVIVPYDDNRVVLTDGYSEEGATDFVNASYIKGFTSRTRYIAAQGPRDNTAMDFWRTVWQERVKDIVMLTSLQEGGKNKCYEYWPAKETSQVYGPVKVTGIDVQSRAYFIMRTFVLSMDKGEELNVTQYHFTSWPDHSVPGVTSLVDFWRFVKSHCISYDSSSPLLVHCSAGVGRSGTYIGLDIAMDKLLHKREINLLEIVDGMRNDRTLMVQTPEQYVFLHKALLEAYTGRDTKLSIDKFDGVISQSITTVTPNRRIDVEFQTVMLMRSLTAGQSHDTAITDDNVMKNRNKEVLPADEHAVYLTEHVPGRNQYINAVYMSTFTKNRGSILTQLPLSSTLVDFWRLVYGTSATTVVSLGSPHDESVIQDFCCFWNGNKGTSQKDPIKVTLNTSTSLGNNLVSYTVTLTKKDTTLSREIQVLRYDGWLHDIPDKSDILQLIDTLDTMPAMRGNNPVIIQCIDGGAKSGFFCAIRDIISRVTYDYEVDVYMTVRSVQSVRPEAVTTVEQYRYCYEVAQHKVREMSVYANL